MRTINELNELDFTYKVLVTKHKTYIDTDDYGESLYIVYITGEVITTSASVKITADWSVSGEARSDNETYEFEPIEFRNISVAGTTIVDESNKPIDQVRLQGLLAVAFESPDNELVDAIKNTIKHYTHDEIESIHDTRCD